MSETRTETGFGLWLAGLAISLLFHVALAALLLLAGTSGATDPTAEKAEAKPESRRLPDGYDTPRGYARRGIEGPWHRAGGFEEGRFSRRTAIQATTRRRAAEAAWFPFRSLAVARGRRGLAAAASHERRSLDYGPPEDEEVLQAMLIPRLGKKKANKRKLPKLVKYEQPERFESGVNISRENEDPKELKHKAFKHKKAELDRKRRRKPSLGDLIDAPEDDDPRKRAKRLDDIIGDPGGSTYGTGTDARAGDIYLGKVEMKLRRSFSVPVFLTEDELKKLRVDIKIIRMNSQGRILKYKVQRRSGNRAFDGAAIDAVKRFVPEEGGTKRLPAPDIPMLDMINRRGILIKLEGRKLK